MAVDFEDAEKNLRNLVEWLSQRVGKQDINEETKRLQLIDRLFFECLGWERDDCTAEEREDGRYTDYSFSCPKRLLIVEAKKEGVYFELPVGTTKLKYEIEYFLRRASEVGNAIRQAMKYCQSRGTPFGAVCNGHQLVAFIASRSDGQSPLAGKALVFDSLEHLEQNFLVGWQCLSRAGVMNRRLSQELQDTIVAPVPEKLSAKILGYPGFKRRNDLQTNLQILSDLFIEDITRLGVNEEEDEFLRECYCQSGALSQYATMSKEILQARYSTMFQDAAAGPTMSPVTTKKGPSSELLAERLSGRPILLIGDRGVGKTMFIKHLHRIDASDVFRDALVFYIDFGSKPAIMQDVQRFIADEITRQFLDVHGINIDERNFVKGVLHRDLERFEKGIYGDIRESDPEKFRMKRVEFLEGKVANRDEYLQACLNHVSRGRKKQIVIFLDNVDQRASEFQESAFLTGQAMATNWPVTVFISIRPETFYRSRMSGTLSAYHARAFTIAPPRVDEVVGKRLRYGIQIQLSEKGMDVSTGGQVSVRTEGLRDYLKVLDYSFVQNRELKEFLDNMCGGNIRLALDFVRAFIGSGHVDTGKILDIYRQTGEYLVPLHEFLRAVTYGDHEHYSPAASEIVNVFDISTPDGKEHFLSPILLAQLDRWAQQPTTDGFVPISDIYEYLQALGFGLSQIHWALERLLPRNLVESASKLREYPAEESGSHYRVTSVGSYYVKRLICTFSYVDAMVVDTPITDPQMRQQIAEAHLLTDRLERARVFCEYLDSQWHALSEQQLSFEWPAVKKALERDVNRITHRISLRKDAGGA